MAVKTLQCNNVDGSSANSSAELRRGHFTCSYSSMVKRKEYCCRCHLHEHGGASTTTIEAQQHSTLHRTRRRSQRGRSRPCTCSLLMAQCRSSVTFKGRSLRSCLKYPRYAFQNAGMHRCTAAAVQQGCGKQKSHTENRTRNGCRSTEPPPIQGTTACAKSEDCRHCTRLPTTSLLCAPCKTLRPEYYQDFRTVR